jgi:hypothetical protein
LRNSYLIASLILAAVLGLCGPSWARDVSLHKHSADELKSVCAKVGGSFSQGGGVYGCGTNCNGGPGTDCMVNCDASQTCTAQVIGHRRPTTLQNALQAPAGSPR